MGNLKTRLQEKREQKLILKEQEKERIRIHKEMVKKNDESLREEKIAPSDAFISLQNINKIYPNHVQAVYDFNLDIKEHEFIVFVGPSGCGKSTTLRMIAGLEDITYGNLFINGKYTNYIPARDRDIAMVFQSYALYPHLNVYENMAFSLKLHKVPKEEIDKRINEAAEILQIQDYLQRRPAALSGGQMQRVALGRAIVRKCNLFLMDEPLSNLDAKLRVSMRSEIIKLHNRLNATTIYVTHDQTEAMTMATRIVIMNKGYIQQIGTPQEIYNHPINTFVATFIGSPSMNLLTVEVDDKHIYLDEKNKFDNKVKLDSISHKFCEENLKKYQENYAKLEQNFTNRNVLMEKAQELEKLPELNKKQQKEHDELVEQIDILNKSNEERNRLIHLIDEYSRIANERKSKLIMGVRPDNIAISTGKAMKGFTSDVDAVVDLAELLGNQLLVHALVGEQKITFITNADKTLMPGDKIKICFNLEQLHFFDPVTQNIIKDFVK